MSDEVVTISVPITEIVAGRSISRQQKEAVAAEPSEKEVPPAKIFV